MLIFAMLAVLAIALLSRLGVAADIMELRRTRSATERLDDVVNVKEFGAVGDGVTDDYKACQLAANHAKAAGKSLYFPSGVYLITRMISLAGATNISVYGDGLCNSRIHLYSLTGTDALACMAISDGAAQITVRGLYFTVDDNSVMRNCCLAVEYASSVFISDCFFGGSIYNINLRGVIDSGVDNCSFENGSTCGVYLNDNTGNAFSPSNPAIRLGCARISFNNCIIVTNGGGTTNTDQYIFNGVTLAKAYQTVFTGCHFYGNTDTNVYVLVAIDAHFIGCHFGDPVGGSANKNFIMVNSINARLYLTGCNFGDGNAGATPIKDVISLGFAAGAETHVVNCKVNAVPSRNVVYDTDGSSLKTWLSGPAPIPTLAGVAWCVCTDGRWVWSDGSYKTYYKHGRPASTTDGAVFAGGLDASAVYDPPNLADGAGVTTTVACVGAALGDFASASFSNALQGITVTAWVSAADTVSVRFQNESGGAIDLASGTLRVRTGKA